MRNMTQKELGIAVGFSAKSADVRIAQYEIGARVPKEKLVQKIADVLKVSAGYLSAPSSAGKEDVMRFLFFLDDHDLLDLKLNEADTEGGEMANKINVSFDYIDNMLESWYDQKVALRNGVITEEEYDNWKLNWDQLKSDWYGMPLLNFDDE
jgi:transcriptional regulator with XRE-family HTH domain